MKHVLILAIALSFAPVFARADDDQARARAALEAGRILPLEKIVDAAKARTQGTILDVELDDDDDHLPPGQTRWKYEVKALTPDGRVIELEYDAQSGALLREKQKRRD